MAETIVESIPGVTPDSSLPALVPAIGVGGAQSVPAPMARWDARTIDAATDAAVTTWADLVSGKALALTAGSGGVLREVGGERFVSLEGGDDLFASSAFSAVPKTFAFVAKNPSDGRFAFNSASGLFFERNVNGGVTLTGGLATANGSWTDNTWGFAGIVNNGANSIVQANGVQNTGSTASGAGSYLELGRIASGQPIRGLGIQTALVWSQVLTAAQLSQVYAALQAGTSLI